MRKVNDFKIYRNKYYAWYYMDNLKVNLIPISYYTYEQAKFTLGKQFGKEGLAELHIIKGSIAIRDGLILGKNSFKHPNGKSYQVKKYYIPPEFAFNRSRRRSYIKRLRRLNKNNQPSGVNKLVNNYFMKTHGTR